MKRTSEILKSLCDKSREEVTIGEMIKESGSRTHGFALLLFALPEAVPLPLPSVSIVLGIPLVLISAHLIIFGEGSGIPERLRRQRVRASVVQKAAKHMIPVFEKLERVSRQRFEGLASRHRLLGVACLLLSIVILLPIPLANFAPAACLAAIAFGMLQRDGVIVMIGLIGSAALIATLVAVTASVANNG